MVAGALAWVILGPSPPPPAIQVVPLDVFVSQDQPPPIRVQAPTPARAKLLSPVRQVFGVNREALTDDSGEVAVKPGNTLAKTPDSLALKPDDPSSLPIPTEEYLVTRMPELLSEVRVPYPIEAKQKHVQGPVVFDLLLDATGQVRESQLITGPGFGLNEAALQAIRKFRFKPALVEDKAVAIRFRYTYRFVLE